MSLNRTPLAAISYSDDSGLHIRVYYQVSNGDIKEAAFDEGSNWLPAPESTVGTGKLNTGIAVVSWPSDGRSTRVYFLAPDNKITERNRSGTGSWSNGELTGRFEAAPYSKLAAVALQQNDDDIRVYYQDPTNTLKEIIYTHSQEWHAGASLPAPALTGSSIAASVVYEPDLAGRIWVYYQDVDTTLKELFYTGSEWTTGSFTATSVFPPGASLSAVLWSNAPQHDRVASVDENNQLCITPNDGSWGPTFNVGEEAITLSDVALVSVDGESDLRLFYQQVGGGIAELGSIDGNTWAVTTANILG